MKTIIKQTIPSILLLIATMHSAYSIAQIKTGSRQIRERRDKAIQMIQQIALDALEGKTPSIQIMRKLRRLYPYIPKQYNGLKAVLKEVPKQDPAGQEFVELFTKDLPQEEEALEIQKLLQQTPTS